MATLVSTLRTTRITAVLTAIDASATAGTLELLAANGTTVLAILTLADPSGAVSGDVLTFDCTPALETTGEAAASTGTAATLARIKNGDGTVVVSGLTVGTSGTDVVMSPSNTVVSGEAVTITALTITEGNT